MKVFVVEATEPDCHGEVVAVFYEKRDALAEIENLEKEKSKISLTKYRYDEHYVR